MFDKNVKLFIDNIGLNNLSHFIENECGNFDTYDSYNHMFFNRGKQLYHNPYEINLNHLRMIDKVNRGECLGEKFKDRLYQGRCEEFLEGLK